ncbi:MAG: bifunctional folylpolyglutamate synthase/dihydrofolate synthase [Synergistaceae bacterium]|nr:bifunctional folylpolyglutamate synthase/dihydrofolate synthase [Synergistaceae bacterium]
MFNNSFSGFERLITKLSSPGIRPGLERVERLLKLIGDPQNKFPAIHVVGTNGKGSTAAFLNSILNKSGYKTALYTSPHLISPEERLLICGHPLSENEWLECAAKVAETIKNDSILSNDPPSYFEILTAIAFMLIEKNEVDIAVIEAGLGGRLDATNTLGDVIVSVITSISMDHMEYLGDTLEKIASEKFAVVRDYRKSVYLGDNESLYKNFKGNILMRDAFIKVINVSVEGNCYDFSWDKYRFSAIKTSLIGEYQIYNSALAIFAVIIASSRFPGINESSIREGLISACWMGRMELIAYDSGNKFVLMDGGHNEDGIAKLVKSVNEIFKSSSKIAVVYAAMRDKDLFGCLSHINELNASIYCTEVPGNERSASIQDLDGIAGKFDWRQISYFKDPMDAINAAKTDNNDLVIVCGSLYFIGYLRPRIMSML